MVLAFGGEEGPIASAANALPLTSGRPRRESGDFAAPTVIRLQVGGCCR